MYMQNKIYGTNLKSFIFVFIFHDYLQKRRQHLARNFYVPIGKPLLCGRGPHERSGGSQPSTT